MKQRIITCYVLNDIQLISLSDKCSEELILYLCE